MFINDRQLQMLRDIQQAVNTPQWMLEAKAEEEGWTTDDDDDDDDQHAGNAWWNTQFDDVPF